MINKIVNEIYPKFEGMDDYFIKYSSKEFASFCHSMLSGGISMWIRNNYKLWDEESKYHKYFVEELGIEHPDDMSAEIVKQVYKKYNEEIQISNKVPRV